MAKRTTITRKHGWNILRRAVRKLDNMIDEDNMSSNTDEAVPTQQSVKAYVDTEIDSSSTDGFTPTTYAAEESITFPNGLVFKHGYKARSGNDTTVTFGTAFGTGVVSANISFKDTASGDSQLAPAVKTFSTSSLVINCTVSVDGYYWQAWGY